MMAEKFTLFTLKNIPTANFLMTALELKEYIDFTVKRIYFITSITGVTSTHCHYEEEELFIMIAGSCTAIIDKGQGIEEIEIHAPKHAIFVPRFVWHGFKNFSTGAVLMAASSTNYREDRSDYLADYTKYLKIRDEKLT